MKIKIKIGWKEYDVQIKQDVYVDNQQCFGSVDHTNAVINLWGENSPDQMRATLLHEIIHGVDDMYNIKLEEDHVVMLANALYSVMLNNDGLIDYLKGGDELEVIKH